MADTRCSGPVSQPIFQPVKEKVLPADEMVMVRSAAPGSVATGMCLTPKVRCSYTSSVMMRQSCFAGQVDDALKYFPREDSAGGIVRVVEQHHPGAVAEGGLKRRHVREGSRGKQRGRDVGGA